MNDIITPEEKVTNYFNTLESRLGYTLLLKGTKHLGYYPEGRQHLTMIEAQRLMEDKIAEKLDLPGDSLVLDAGCGEGNVAIYLAQRFNLRIKGIDLLDFAIERAKIKAANSNLQEKVEFLQMDYTQPAFQDGVFDGIFTIETLVHAVDYKQAVQQFYRLLKPKGKLVLFEYSMSTREELTERQKSTVDMINQGAAMHSLPYFNHEGLL